METKTNVTLNDVIEDFILPKLLGMGNYKFNIFSDAGEYNPPQDYYERYSSIHRGEINTLIEATDSEFAILGGGLKAAAMNISIRFLLPIEDEIDKNIEYHNLNGYSFNNGYSFISAFREDLSNAFSGVTRVTVYGYEGGAFVSLPAGGEFLQRQGIGKSYEYTCYIQLAFLENAVNSSLYKFYISYILPNGESTAWMQIPFTKFSISRKNTLSANLYSNNEYGLSKVFAENSIFGIDLAMPMVSTGGPLGRLIENYIGIEHSANQLLSLKVMCGVNDILVENVIFGDVTLSGAGVENASVQFSLVPYIEAEDD